MDDRDAFVLGLAGRQVAGAWDRIRRYCGLEWSGGPPETWAFRYYDTVETDPEMITAVDVLAASALHPGLTRADLAYFWDRRDELERWLHQLPVDTMLRDADDGVLDRLNELAGWQSAPSLSLLTKVLHRKRPQLMPLVDRAVLDLYRPLTGERTATAAWPALLRALRADLGDANGMLFAIMAVSLDRELDVHLAHLRLLDIAIWTADR